MDDEIIVQAEPITELIRQQIDTLLVAFARPALQRQVVVIVLILVMVWLLPELIRRWLQRRDPEQMDTDSIPAWRRRLIQLYQLFGPLVSLILVYASIWLFVQLGYPNGLLQNSRVLFWIWLAYRALLLVLYARFGQEIGPYHHRLFTPLFVLLVLWEIVDNLIGIALLAEIPLFSFGNSPVTLGNFMASLIALYLFLVGAWFVERVLNQSLTDRTQADPGIVQTITTLTRYGMIALGIVVSLSILGLNLTSLAIIAGGLSVGIGIGLQDVVSNFVSGLLLLFEQSLRPGDVIEMDGAVSEVKKIGTRATIVRTLDNIEVIVPNATFTNTQVATLTKSDRRVRVRLPFGVSYDSNPQQVKQVAEQAAMNNKLVLAKPGPELLFMGYGDSSIDFELVVWIEIDQPEMRIHVKSELYYAMWAALAENEIEIPYPQRDLNLRRGWEKLMVASQ
jgi:small-conductance mechanosensitive channel